MRCSNKCPTEGTASRHALLKASLFSITASSHGLQTLCDRQRVHSLKNQQENKDIRSHITDYIAQAVLFQSPLFIRKLNYMRLQLPFNMLNLYGSNFLQPTSPSQSQNLARATTKQAEAELQTHQELLKYLRLSDRNRASSTQTVLKSDPEDISIYLVGRTAKDAKTHDSSKIKLQTIKIKTRTEPFSKSQTFLCSLVCQCATVISF